MKSLSLKWFALLGLLLFLGVAVAPSINADVKQSSISHTSPLFQARTGGALNQDYEINDNHFLGENQQTELLFVNRDENLSKIIKIIQQMDDSTYAFFIERVLFESTKNIALSHNENKQLIQAY